MPLKSMSSAAELSVLSSISTSSSFPLETEENFDEEEEYIPLLTSRQRFVESDFEEDEEEDTRSVRKGRRKPVKTVQLPPPPPNFEHFVHPKPLHRAFINLPPNYEANFSKPINLFLLFFPNSILDTIVVNTNLYALTKNTGAVGRK